MLGERDHLKNGVCFFFWLVVGWVGFIEFVQQIFQYSTKRKRNQRERLSSMTDCSAVVHNTYRIITAIMSMTKWRAEDWRIGDIWWWECLRNDSGISQPIMAPMWLVHRVAACLDSIASIRLKTRKYQWKSLKTDAWPIVPTGSRRIPLGASNANR